MSLVLRFLELVRALSEPLAAELQQMAARLNAWAKVEHNTDGTHRFPWTNETFDANAFSASGSMTWTVQEADVFVNRYRRVGKALEWQLGLQDTAVGGVASTSLSVRLPGGVQAGGYDQRGPYACVDNGTASCGMWRAAAGSTELLLYVDAAAGNWAAAGTTNMWVSLTVEIA